jgi:hypothetical protein
MSRKDPPSPWLRITVTAEVTDQPGQEYTVGYSAAEMLLAVTDGLNARGLPPSLLRLEIGPIPTTTD